MAEILPNAQKWKHSSYQQTYETASWAFLKLGSLPNLPANWSKSQRPKQPEFGGLNSLRHTLGMLPS